MEICTKKLPKRYGVDRKYLALCVDVRQVRHVVFKEMYVIDKKKSVLNYSFDVNLPNIFWTVKPTLDQDVITYTRDARLCV